MVKDLDDLIIRTGSRILIPFMQLYGLYVFAHGHSSPGGGFQGGCIVAASFILLAVSFNLNEARKRFSEKTNVLFCALGVFIYVGTGFVPVFFGGNFLDYAKWTNILPVNAVMARYYGIALIELGVQVTVMAVMVSIFFDLVTAGKHEELLEEEVSGEKDAGTDLQ